ncbi:MAG TPA: DUF1080 domain-containing protein [Phycisphaerae bacterium]|nr:DUF1080 domain-containing protein [Phycisphaerae bacterium]
MKPPHRFAFRNSLLIAAAALALGTGMFLLGKAYGQQAAAQPVPGGGGARGGARSGRGALLPDATTGQYGAINQMSSAMAAELEKVMTARRDLIAATFASPRDDAGTTSKLEELSAAEDALAKARATGIATIQSTPNKLTAPQLTALAARDTQSPGGQVTNPADINSRQLAALMQLTGITQKLQPAVIAARTALNAAAFAEPRDDAAIKAKLAALIAAETALATARADELAKLQATPDKLSAAQLAIFINSNGVIVSGAFNEPQPLDFNDHAGYTSLFDGKTLKGWDGNPKFFRAEDGCIVGESTPQNPSGNSYIAYRDLEAHDFTLKLEVKVEGAGGTGIQYRSKTGIPWLTAVQPNVIANAGPTNLDWMMTGPQADFWPSRDATAKYSGQFYSENTPMRIMAWRGQVVEGFGMGPRRLMANIGDRTEMAKFIKQNDWNQYTVIARGPVFMHIINGQLMSVMIDDDPASSNNGSGQIGVEIEATTKVMVRDIWLKKLN